MLMSPFFFHRLSQESVNKQHLDNDRDNCHEVDNRKGEGVEQG